MAQKFVAGIVIVTSSIFFDMNFAIRSNYKRHIFAVKMINNLPFQKLC